MTHASCTSYQCIACDITESYAQEPSEIEIHYIMNFSLGQFSTLKFCFVFLWEMWQRLLTTSSLLWEGWFVSLVWLPTIVSVFCRYQISNVSIFTIMFPYLIFATAPTSEQLIT